MRTPEGLNRRKRIAHNDYTELSVQRVAQVYKTFDYAGLHVRLVNGAVAVIARRSAPDVVVATARRHRRTWQLRVPGYDWEVSPGSAAALVVGVGKRLPVKSFKSWQAAVKEAARLLLV